VPAAGVRPSPEPAASASSSPEPAASVRPSPRPGGRLQAPRGRRPARRVRQTAQREVRARRTERPSVPPSDRPSAFPRRPAAPGRARHPRRAPSRRRPGRAPRCPWPGRRRRPPRSPSADRGGAGRRGSPWCRARRATRRRWSRSGRPRVDDGDHPGVVRVERLVGAGVGPVGLVSNLGPPQLLGRVVVVVVHGTAPCLDGASHRAAGLLTTVRAGPEARLKPATRDGVLEVFFSSGTPHWLA